MDFVRSYFDTNEPHFYRSNFLQNPYFNPESFTFKGLKGLVIWFGFFWGWGQIETPYKIFPPLPATILHRPINTIQLLSCLTIPFCSLLQIFEKVLVQNILFGLSPSFTNALQTIPRWRFISATLPHIMHCASSMLQYR